MLTRKIQKVNNSHLITIPAQICAMLGITAGKICGIEVENKKIVIAPLPDANLESDAASIREELACLPTT